MATINKIKVNKTDVYDIEASKTSGTLTLSGATSGTFDGSKNVTITIPTIAGPTGPHGPTGATGPTGPIGPTGPTGSVASFAATGTGNVVTDITLNSNKTVTVTKGIKVEPLKYVTLDSAQTITGTKTFNAPAAASGKEQATATFKTANGGQIIFGKEGSNSGSMIALDQVAGTRRLNFRASSTAGAIVWEQPESNSCLYYDVKNVSFRETTAVSFDGATAIKFSHFANASALGTDSSGNLKKVSLAKVATSGSYNDLSNKPTNFATTTQLDTKLDKNNASGTGSFTWTNTEKGKPIDIKFVATTAQSGVDVMGFPATDILATLTGSAFSGNTKFTLQSGYSDGDGPSIVIDNNGYTTIITANGINPGNTGNIQWPTSGGRFVTSGNFADATATDPSANQGKIPTIEYPGTVPLKFIKPMVSMYASESELPAAVHFSPYYVPDALYVTTDTNSIYRYNKDTESYVKLGADTSTFLDKGTSSTVVNQVVYNPVEMKKALTVPSIQTTPIQYGPTDYGSAVSLGYTTVNGKTKAQIQLACPGLGYTRITQDDNSFKIAATDTLSCDSGWGWRINESKIMTESNFSFDSSTGILTIN